MRVTVLTGPYAGRTRDVPADVDPLVLLAEFAEADWQWECEWDSARDETEWFAWARADMASRIMRALLHGRPVWFLSVEYRARTRTDVPGVALAVEDAISNSGLYVVVESDDEVGVRIGVGPAEQQTRN